MPSYGSSAPVTVQNVISGLSNAIDTTATPKLIVTEDTILEVGDEKITGKQLSQMIKAMKIQFPEVFI